MQIFVVSCLIVEILMEYFLTEEIANKTVFTIIIYSYYHNINILSDFDINISFTNYLYIVNIKTTTKDKRNSN